MLRILINPAHGGNDLGHRSFQAYSLICEKDYVLCLSQKQQESLKEAGAQVFLTRDKDVAMSIPSRLAMTDQMDVFISNHLNMGRKRGIEIYYSVHSDGKLANRLKKGFEEKGFLVRQCHARSMTNDKNEDYYPLLKDSKAKESVMIMYGYVDSDDISRLMTCENEYTEIVTDAIMQTQTVQV